MLLLQGETFCPQLRSPLEVVPLGGAVFLVGQVLHLLLHLLQFARRAFQFYPKFARSFVDQVDGLVRQETVGNVPLAQFRRSGKGRIRDGDFVMRLVPRPQSPKDLYRVLHRRLFYIHRLEPTLQGGVLLYVLPVFIQGRRPDTLQLASCQRRLQHRARVYRPLRRPRPDNLVYLVYEQDDLPPCLTDFVHYRLQPLFEFAPELAPRHHRPHVQRYHLPPLHRVRYVARDNSLGQSLGYGRLPHTGLTYDHRVVLRPPRQDLNNPPYLLFPTDHRVQLPPFRQFRQVGTVFLQGLVPAFRPGIGHPVCTPDLLQRLVHLLLFYPELLEDIRCVSLPLFYGGHQQVVHTDEFVPQPIHLRCGPVLQH